MGIQGLLPLLKSIHKPTHLRNFAGQTLGVDAYGWLHRGTVSCAIELAQQKPTRKHIDFALSRVRMLIHFGVKPYLVFDGAYLPSKEHTEKDRAARRKESKKLGLELLAMGRISQAHLELQKAVDVTPLMARELIEELKRLDVSYVVAPFEADSQLAYLEKHGFISGVVSEDSDLLVFGVKCLLTKLDQYGECVMINRADFTACRDISLVGWTDHEFRMMAMLSGCDYLPGIEKMGLKTAYRLVRKHKTVERLIRAVQFEGKMKVPAGYLDAFDRAEKTFLFQWVFCPKDRCLVHLNKRPDEMEKKDMPYIGEAADPETAAAIAAGDLDPNTKERLSVHPLVQRPANFRTRVVHTPDEKQGKPISEFFKPKRTPLAELDPNSFTPSPSQQSLLESQHGSSWSASHVQAGQIPAHARITAQNGPATAPPAARRAHSDNVIDPTRRSPKRQRLCSDSMLSSSMNGSIYEQNTSSRFFTSRDVQPSPSLRKPSAQKKRTDDFELWSDDPAVEAVAALTDSAETSAEPTKKSKKTKVYADQEIAVTGTPAEESQEANRTQSTNLSQPTSTEETPPTSFETIATSADRTVFSKGVDADFAALKAKYTFQATPLRNQPTRVKSMPLSARTPLQETQRNGLLGRLAKPQLSEKQRLPHDVLTTKVEITETASAEEILRVPNSSPPQTDQAIGSHADVRGDHDEDFISDSEWLEVEQQEDHSIHDGQLIMQGSEDLLVPNSPESGVSEHEQRVAPAFNLARFAFTGR